MPDPPKKTLCPECEKEIPADAKECGFCHFDLESFQPFKRLMNAFVKDSQRSDDPNPAPAPEKKKGGFFDVLAGKKKAKK